MPDALAIAGYIARGAAAALAIFLARRRAEYRPVCWFIVLTLLADLLRLGRVVAGLASGLRPFAGWFRAAYHVDQALFLTWPFGLIVLVAIVFAPHVRRRATRVTAAVYLAIVAGLALGYPTIRGPLLANVYAVAFGASVVATIAGMVAWWPRRARPRPEHAVTSALGLLNASLFAGPFLPPAPDPFMQWATAQAVYLMLWTTVILVEGGSLWWGWWLAPSQRGWSQRLQ